MRGKFIVIYGINNLGKSTQAKLLVENFQKNGLKCEYLKYPLYTLEPAGPIINGYLREGNPYKLSPRELQIMHVVNRTQFEPQLKTKLDSGINIIAEDYTGTGLAWGVGGGVDQAFLERINGHLLKEDFAFLFKGKRFTDGIEKNNVHEQNNDLTIKVGNVFEQLGVKFGWININANQEKSVIANELWQKLQNTLK